MRISPDHLIFWQYGIINLSGTLVFTWITMLFLVMASRYVTRRLTIGIEISRWQCALEIVVTTIRSQLREVGLQMPEKYIGFIGTLFLFIFTSNILSIIPYFEPPTASLSTTIALALAVFAAVPAYGIREKGLKGYFHEYLEPSPLMLPFHILSEVTRTFSLAIRLFGNMMSGGLTIALLLSIAPFMFPMLMTGLGLLIGTVQAYIFSILAAVYITSATQNNE